MASDEDFDQAILSLRELIPAFPRNAAGMKLTSDWIAKFVGPYATAEQLEWLVNTAVEESAHWPERPTIVILMRDIWTRKYPRADKPPEPPINPFLASPPADSAPRIVTQGGHVPANYAVSAEYVRRFPGTPGNPSDRNWCPVFKACWRNRADPCAPHWWLEDEMRGKQYRQTARRNEYIEPFAPPSLTPAQIDERVGELERQIRNRDEIIRRLQLSAPPNSELAERQL